MGISKVSFSAENIHEEQIISVFGIPAPLLSLFVTRLFAVYNELSLCLAHLKLLGEIRRL